MNNTKQDTNKKAIINTLFNRIVDILNKKNIDYDSTGAEFGILSIGFGNEYCYESDFAPYWKENKPIIRFHSTTNYWKDRIVDIGISESDDEISDKLTQMEHDMIYASNTDEERIIADVNRREEEMAMDCQYFGHQNHYVCDGCCGIDACCNASSRVEYA